MSKTSKTADSTTSIVKSATDIVFIASLIVIVVGASYLYKFGFPWSPLPTAAAANVVASDKTREKEVVVPPVLEERRANQAVWGQLGDYMGGMLNPILSFFALYLLMRTIQIQQVQVAQTERALAAATGSNEIAALAAALEVISEDIKQMQNTPNYSNSNNYTEAVMLKGWLANEIATRARSLAVKTSDE